MLLCTLLTLDEYLIKFMKDKIDNFAEKLSAESWFCGNWDNTDLFNARYLHHRFCDLTICFYKFRCNVFNTICRAFKQNFLPLPFSADITTIPRFSKKLSLY